ncbi:hypothetical protein HQ520_13435 [bacterium]|nr:hypothetical protein [bacterium]
MSDQTFRRSTAFWPLVLTMALLPALLWSGWLVQHPVRRMWEALEYPFQLDAEEGHILGQALRLRNGEGLYPAIEEPPYVVDNYPPLYPALWALFVDPDAPSLTAGRWISFLASLATALAAVLICAGVAIRSTHSRMGGDSGESGGGLKSVLRTSAVSLIPPLAAGLLSAFFFLNAREVIRWSAYSRVDLLALALSAVGLAAFVWSGEGRRRWWGWGPSIALFALSLLTKQTCVAAPAACLTWLLLVNWRRALIFGGWLAAAALVPVGILCTWTGGRYWLHTVTYNENVMIWNEYLRIWLPYMTRLHGYLLAAGGVAGLWLVGFSLLGRRGVPKAERDGGNTNSRLFWLPVLYALLNAGMTLSLAKAGSAENYLLEPVFALAVLAGCGLAAMAREIACPSAGRSGRTIPLVTVVAFVLCLVPVTFHVLRHVTARLPKSGETQRIYLPRIFYGNAPRPTVEAYQAGRRVVRLLQERPGESLSEDPIYLLRAGKEIVFQNFIMTQLAAERKWDDSALVERALRGEFSVVVSHVDLSDPEQFFNRYTRALREALAERYEVLEILRRSPPLQTIFVYVPSSD